MNWDDQWSPETTETGTVRNGRQLTKPLTKSLTKPLTKFIIVNSRIWPLGQIRRVHCVYSFLVVLGLSLRFEVRVKFG